MTPSDVTSGTDSGSDSGADDQHLLAHQFIRLFGRRPTRQDLDRYRSAQTRVRNRMRARVRRSAATFVTRW